MKREIILSLLFITLFIYAKEVKIKIIDSDLNIPLEGAKVTLAKNGASYISDKDGLINFDVSNDLTSLNANISYPGYQAKKISISDFDIETVINMSIGNVLEGKEIVIEKKKIEKDEELGVSSVVDRNQLKSTAMSGFGQDVMNAIKTLPGVSSGGGMGGFGGGGMGGTRGTGNLSIRGGDTDGLTTVMDGFIVRYPYQWGGLYSIFSPNVVDTVKFSSGIFASKYGMATDALMDVNTITPDEGFKLMSMLSLTDSELYVQLPLWKNSGILLGGRFLYYDLINLIMNPMGSGSSGGMPGGGSNSSSQYLRDGYFKWFWKPTNKFEFYVNGFFGSDGQTSKMNGSSDITKEISSNFNMDYYNYDTFWNAGLKISPNDKVFIQILAGYEYLLQGSSGTSGYFGTHKYSDGFKSYYNTLRLLNPSLPDISGKDSYSIDISGSSKSSQILNSIQSRGDFDIALHEKVMMSVGGGGILDFNKSYSSGEMWTVSHELDSSSNMINKYEKNSFNSESEDKKILRTFLYTDYKFNIIPETLKIDTGLRIDHFLFVGPGYTINTYPTINPRYNLTYSPLKGLNYLDLFSISFGSGLFSKAPDVSNVTANMGLHDFDISVPQTLTSVIGTEFKFPFGINFKLETYYKFMFSRSYITTSSSGSSMSYNVHKDGIGHAVGFDLSIVKTFSKWLDGSLSYSFVYTRLLNPSADGANGNISGEPLGEWYYPSYHKFHNFNVVLNIKPTGWCTITPKFTLSSGAPQTDTSTSQSYAILSDEQVAEMYYSSSTYSDDERNDLSIQFDLKVSFGSFIPRTMVRWEVFASVENIFSFLYSAKSQTMINTFTGTNTMSSGSNYSAQSLIPSVGIKIDF